MKTLAIQGVILIALYKFAPNATAKAMVLGAAGTLVLGNVPYLNGKDISGTAIA